MIVDFLVKDMGLIGVVHRFEGFRWIILNKKYYWIGLNINYG